MTPLERASNMVPWRGATLDYDDTAKSILSAALDFGELAEIFEHHLPLEGGNTNGSGIFYYNGCACNGVLYASHSKHLADVIIAHLLSTEVAA